MLGVVGSGFDPMVKFDPTRRNMLQHVATGWPNARNMLRPTMLGYVALACCDRLAGALKPSRDSLNVRDGINVPSIKRPLFLKVQHC